LLVGLLDDPDGLLPVGPNSRSAMRMVFTSVDDVVKQNPRSAILSRRPKSTPRRTVELPLSDDSTTRRTTAALDSDTELAEAWRGTRPPTAIIYMWAVPNNQLAQPKRDHPDGQRLQRTIILLVEPMLNTGACINIAQPVQGDAHARIMPHPT
jgi:hypothetical protein